MPERAGSMPEYKLHPGCLGTGCGDLGGQLIQQISLLRDIAPGRRGQKKIVIQGSPFTSNDSVNILTKP